MNSSDVCHVIRMYLQNPFWGKPPESQPHQRVSPKSDPFSLMSLQRDCLCPGWKWFLWSVYFLRFSCTSLRICSSSLDVSYSFSISYGLHGSAHFWACSIISGVKHRSKRIPLMLNLGRSQRLDHGFGFIFTFNYERNRVNFLNLVTEHSRCTIYHYR